MRGKVNIQMANYSSFARYSETSVVPSQIYWRMFIPGRENKTHENWTSEVLSLEQVFNLILPSLGYKGIKEGANTYWVTNFAKSNGQS